MEILDKIAKQFLIDANADGKVDIADVVGSLEKLLADATGKLNFSSLIEKFKNLDISEAVASWLGDGENAKLSIDSVNKIFDPEQLNKFAASLNIDVESAKNGLCNAIPNLIDQVSSGGNLLDSFNEHAAKLQAEATEMVDTVKAVAEEKTEGLLGKIKSLFS